jgi:hypothetical protein
MKTRLPIKTQMLAQLIRNQGINAIIPVGTWWDFELYRLGKLVDKWGQKNVTTTEGLNYLINTGFFASTPITAWYVGLFEDNYTPLITNLYASPGFTESTAYDEATRPAYTVVAATNGAITNTAAKATFTISTTKTMYGAFLCGGGTDADTKGDAAGGGTLFCSVKFGTPKDVVDNDVLMVVGTVALSDY